MIVDLNIYVESEQDEQAQMLGLKRRPTGETAPLSLNMEGVIGVYKTAVSDLPGSTLILLSGDHIGVTESFERMRDLMRIAHGDGVEEA